MTIQDFQISVTCTVFVKRNYMYLWHYILRVSFHGEVYVDIFKKVVLSLTTFNFMTQICHWLRWLRCFTRLHIKIHSLLATLTMRICIKNSFITDCTDYADIQGNNDYADYIRVRIRGLEMFVFRKIWRALCSWNTRFEIRPFALLPTKYRRFYYYLSYIIADRNFVIFHFTL